MRRLAFLLLLTVIYTLQVQAQVYDIDLHITGTVTVTGDSPVKPPVKPPINSRSTFKDVIGFNGGIQISDVDTDRYNRIKEKLNVFNNHRYFRLLSHDKHPRNNLPQSTGYQCPNISEGWDKGTAKWQIRECDYDATWSTNHAALECIFWPTYRTYPNKSLTFQEMNNNPKKFGYEYCSVIFKDEGKMIDVLQVANEPHGQPSYQTMNEFAIGAKMARDELSPNTRLCSPDCQNTGKDYFNQKELYNQVSKMDTSLYDILDVHSYVFDNNFKLTLPPETISGKWFSPLQEMKDMQAYRSKELVLGEFGYDSKELGEVTQAAYIMRTIFLAMRYGFSKAYVYNSTDDPNAGPFDYTGILTNYGLEKKSYKQLKMLVEKYGDYYFSDAIIETKTDWLFQFSNGTDNVYVSWNINDKSIPKITKDYKKL